MGIAKSTNMQTPAIAPSTRPERRKSTIPTQEPLTPKNSPTSTSCAEASPARRFLQLAGGKDLKMQEVLSSLNWPEWLKRRGLCIFFLKTCLGSFRMTEAGRLASSSPRFMTWGIMSNGLCLTANILESRNQDGGCSLSDILIPDAPEKYFLSLEQMKKLLYRSSMDGWANESMILPESPAHRTPADNPDSTL